MVILEFSVGTMFVLVGLIAFMLGLRIARSDSSDFERNRKRSGSVRAVLRGEAVSRMAGTGPDGVCHEAIAVDRETNQWTLQAALSDEAVDSILFKNHYK